MQTLRACTLLFVFLVVTLIGIPWQAMSVRFGLKRRKTFPHTYHRFLCRLFGIRIRTIGSWVQNEGVLLAANHTSWLDILVFSAVARVSFVAKAEVASWPFFSTLARLQETVFIERARRSQTGQARDQIRERLLAGDALVLFPEGTSNDGNKVLPFKSALMSAAEANLTEAGRHVLVQPVTASYVGLYGMPMGRECRPLFAWYGDMELVPHLWEALKTGPVDVVVEFHAPMRIDDFADRKALTAAAEAAVRRGQARALAGALDGPAEAGAEGRQQAQSALAEALA